MEHVFSYGTLQQTSVQMETFGRRLIGKPDALTGYRIETVEITDPEVLRASGKRIHPILRFTGHAEDVVPGTLLELTEEEVAQADAYEVDDYKRVLARCRSGAEAWVYVEANPPAESTISDCH
jgi:gamma-glutamylcyclotransferase (GGCT)/AIG2-like uncharacterized protein YtfP